MKPNLRVLMVTLFPSFDEEVVGGVAGVAYYLCQHLKEIEGLDVEVLVPNSTSFDARKTKVINGIKTTFIPRRKESTLRRIFATQMATDVSEFATEGKFDVVHLQGMPDLLRELKVPSVLTIHGINERDMLFRGGGIRRRILFPIMRAIEQYRRRQLSNLIVINPYVLEVAGSGLKAKCWEIDNPVRADFFNLTRNLERNTVLFAGVITLRKNVIGLIEATAVVKQTIPDIRLQIAGKRTEPEYAEECDQLIKRLGLESNVEFLGSLSIAELQNALQSAHVFALCSFQETAPLVIEESMAMGVPVVSSRRCGMPHMIVEGETGELVDPNDASSIASGLIRALELDLEKVETSAKEIANSRFRGDIVASKTAAVYREIAGW